MLQQKPPSDGKPVIVGVACILRSVRILFCERVVISCGRVLALMSMCVLLSAMIAMQGSPNVFAIQTMPPTDWSFYMDTTNTSTAYNLGCNQGNFDAGHSPPVSSEVALDFGGQFSNGSGTEMIRGGDITNGQIEAVANHFPRVTGIAPATIIPLRCTWASARITISQ